MPFGIVAKLAAPIVGKAVKAVAGGAVSNLIGGPSRGGMQPVAQRGAPQPPAPKTQPAPGRGPAGGVWQQRAGMGDTLADVIRAARQAGGGMVALNGKIKGIVSTMGRWFTRDKVVALVKRIGPEAAAAALGVGVVAIGQLVAEHTASKPTRRRRGISGRDVDITRRTISKVRSIASRIGCSAPRSYTRRKRCK